MANTLKFGNGQWATGNGTALAYNDENSNFKPLPFDFTRASSGTVVNQSGLIETVGSGIPRIDFLGNTNGALLLEPSRTNKLSTSNDFNGSGWNISNLTVTANQVISPDGTLNASKLEMTGNGSLRNQSEASFNDGYAYSIFVKKGNSRYVTIRSAFFTQSFNCGFDLDTLTAEDNGKIEDYGNDWYRLSIIKNISGDVDRSGFFYLYLPNSLGSQTSVSGNYIYAYGGQIEDGSYATSYIPTSGSAVTRLRDLSDTQNLSHVIGQTEGVIFYDAILVHKSTSTSEDLFELSIDDGSNQNIFFINNYNNTLVVAMVNGGSYQFSNNSFNPTEGARYKLAFAYKQNDFALYINGNQIATDSSGTVPTMNQITFGNYYNNQLNLSNIVKVNNLKFYNTRLSNSELQALTQV